MNLLEPILFLTVFACVITLLVYSIPQMKEAVSVWIGFKYEESVLIKKQLSPNKSKKDFEREKIQKLQRIRYLEHIRQHVTKYWLMSLSGIVILIAELYWFFKLSTLWPSLQLLLTNLWHVTIQFLSK